MTGPISGILIDVPADIADDDDISDILKSADFFDSDKPETLGLPVDPAVEPPAPDTGSTPDAAPAPAARADMPPRVVPVQMQLQVPVLDKNPASDKPDPVTVKRWLTSLDSWGRMMAQNIGETPQRWADVLTLGLGFYPALVAWVQKKATTDPVPTVADLKAEFVRLYAYEVRSAADRARDRLYDRKLLMKSSVAEYNADFNTVMQHLPDMTALDAVRFYHAGLSAHLKAPCVCDSEGKPFATLDSVQAHALVEERKHLMRQNVSASVNLTRAARRSAAMQNPAPTAAQAGTSYAAVASGSNPQTPAAARPDRRRRPDTDAPVAPAAQRRRTDVGTLSTTLSTKFRHPSAVPERAMTMLEVKAFKDGGLCFNCGKHGHMLRACPDPLKHWLR